jgi:predicted transcriptional regulator of viral defense system
LGDRMQLPTFRNMPAIQSQKHLARDLLERHGIMRLFELKALGIHAPTLSRLVEEGTVVRSSRGLDELANAEVDIGHSLAEMAKRVPKGVVCLISALQFHEITLQNPRSIWMAIGEKDRKPAVTHVAARFVRFGAKALTLGVETHTIDSVPVRIFEPAKTIVDCFRYRRIVGTEVALEALRMGLRSRKAKPARIADYARDLRIWSVVRPYLESMAADEE